MLKRLNVRWPEQKDLSEKGFSILEVLVTLVIFSIALLGMLSMQSVSIQNSVQTEERLRATLLANDIASVLMVKGGQNVNTDIDAWVASVKASLPNGEGTVAVVGDVTEINISWLPVSAQGRTDNDRRRYSTVVVP